jgi:hypothetical protein
MQSAHHFSPTGEPNGPAPCADESFISAAARATERSFWRLLGDYERLTRDESAALRDQDFALLEEIEDRKPLLLTQLQELAARAGLDRGYAPLNERLETLRTQGEANSALLAKRIAESRAEHRAMDGLRSRMKGMGQAYGSARPPRTAFSAHG